jgi:tetratricopeptide (TPR) repeat protein
MRNPAQRFLPLRRDGFALLLLALLTAAVYWPMHRYEFVNYDDPDYVTDNTIIQRGLSKDGLAWAFGTLHGRATYWFPLTWITHMLDCQLFGLNAGAHHLSNLLWHLVNVLLLFVVLRRMTGQFWPSALATALFALHPLQVETVAWITERKNLVSTFFFMLTLWAYVRYAESPTLARYGPVFVFFALGLMAKPILVTLPFVLLLLDGWPLKRLPLSQSSNDGQDPTAPAGPDPRFPQTALGRLILEKVPLLLLAFAAGLVTLLAHHGLGMVNFDYGVSAASRLGNALVSYGRYVGNLFWPSDLCAIYPHPGRWPVTTVAGSALFVLLVSGWVIRDACRHPYLVVGWLWFLGLLLPTIGLLQVGSQAMADRFIYLPIVGLLIMLVWGFADLLANEYRRRAICAVLAVSALAGCAAITSLQLRHWKNSVALYERAIAVTENNFVAHSNLGYTLEKQGYADRAMAHLVQALKIRPDFVEARYQMGLILGRVQGPAEAVAQYREVIRLDPNWSPPRLELAKALTRLGQKEDAIIQLFAVVRLTPADPDAHSLLAMLLARQGMPAQAIAHYREALRLRPEWPEALNNLAWLLATHPEAEFRNGPEAARLAERACELSGYQKAMFVGTLAAAYAEAGRFPEAIQSAERARTVAMAQGENELAATNLKLVELYRQGKPCRQEPR